MEGGSERTEVMSCRPALAPTLPVLGCLLAPGCSGLSQALVLSAQPPPTPTWQIAFCVPHPVSYHK